LFEVHFWEIFLWAKSYSEWLYILLCAYFVVIWENLIFASQRGFVRFVWCEICCSLLIRCWILRILNSKI
jgi:hypothetical protein